LTRLSAKYVRGGRWGRKLGPRRARMSAGTAVRAPRCLATTRRHTSTSSVNGLIHIAFGGILMTQHHGFGLGFAWRRSTRAAILCTALAASPAMLNETRAADA